jgi:transitional endoplasmic reticulum ATPase
MLAWFWLVGVGLFNLVAGGSYTFSLSPRSITGFDDFALAVILTWQVVTIVLRLIAKAMKSDGFVVWSTSLSVLNALGAAICYGLYLSGGNKDWHIHAALVAVLALTLPFTGLFFVVAWAFLTSPFRRRQRIAQSAPIPSAQDVARKKVPTKKFADIAGNDAIKARLHAAATSVLQRANSKAPARNGILLHGGPGNGKTIFAEALAGELGIPLLQLSHADVASQWVGEKTARIKQAFEQALRSQPCVLFIDEVDSFLESRTSDRSSGVKEDADMVNALLTLMVDIREARVILVAATNLVDKLDGAGIREGRFDFKVEITPPDMPARLGLLHRGLANNLPGAVVADAVYDAVSRRWNGFSAKRILAVTEELPSYLGRTTGAITFEDFMGALRAVQGQRGAVPENVKTLSELVLSEETRETLEQIVGRMRDPQRTEALGGTLPSGVLFYGPPGTGKTATCKALAKEIGWAFLPITGAELARDPKSLDRLYEKAKELRPTLIFVDEADELLRSREFSPATEATNKLLTLMDGVADRVPDVVWVAATNHPEQIDSALLRGGRFTEKVGFDLPTEEHIAEHVAQWFVAKKVALSQEITGRQVASWMGRQSIANVEAVVQAALNRAISRGGDAITVSRSDIEWAMRLTLGSEVTSA